MTKNSDSVAVQGLPMTTRGFTLIELLVAVVIIALLSGLLLGSISTVRASAVQITCGNNQRQCLAAIISYAGDQEGMSMPLEGELSPVQACRNWYTSLISMDYLPSSQVAAFGTAAGGSRIASMRWPSTVSCTAFRPAANPSAKSSTFAVRWDYNPTWTGVSMNCFTVHGSAHLAEISSDMPFLVDSINSLQTGEGSSYWQADAIKNGAMVHLAHRGVRAIVGYSDGRTGAKGRSDLLGERVLYIYPVAP